MNESPALPLHVLSRLADAQASLDDIPKVQDHPRDEILDAVDELLKEGLATAKQNRGDDRLLAVRELRITAEGRERLREAVAARPAAGPRAPGGDLDERRRRRALFMHALYKATDASTLRSAMPGDIGASVDLAPDEAESVVEYLENEGLLATQTLAGDVSITHAGIKEVEQWIAQPDGNTTHFPAAATIHITGNVYGLQAGTIASTQNMTIAAQDLGAIARFAGAFRAELDCLPDEIRDAARADLDTVDAQLRSPTPRPGVLREALRSLRTVAEGAAASGAFAGAVELAHLLPPL